MALTVNTNISGLTAQNALIRSKNEMDEAMERLATGMRINSGGDDASGLSISTRMESQIRALEVGVKNAADGISLVQTAEGALNEITQMLQRMRELAVQASSGIPNAQDRVALDAEVQALKEEIDRIAGNTIFNDNILFDGSFRTVVQTGPRVHEFVDVSIPNLTTEALGSLSGSTSSRAVTDAIFDGRVADPTVSQLTFDGDDTYRFALTVEVPKEPGGEVYEYTYNISGVVESGSAKDILKDINEQLRSIPLMSSEAAIGTNTTAVVQTAADAIEVSLAGNSITLKNLYGGDIKIDAGQLVQSSGTMSNTGVNQMADASSRIRFTSVNGGENSTSVVLGSDPFAKTALSNIGGSGTSVTSSAGTQAAEFRFEFVNVGLSTQPEVTSISAGDTIALTLVDEIGGETLVWTDAVSDLGGTAAIVSALNNALISAGADGTYEVSADPSNSDGYIITREDGIDFTVKLGGEDSGGNALSASFANTNANISGTLGLRVTPTDLSDSGVSFTTADSDITIRFADGEPGSFGSTNVLQASDGFTIRLTDVGDGQVHTLQVARLQDGSASTVAAALNTAIANAGISDQYEVVAEGNAATSGITITHKLDDQFKVEFTDISQISNAATISIHERLDDLTISTTAQDGLYSTNGVVDGSPSVTVTPRPSVMYLDPLGHDTYKFKFASDAAGTTKTAEITVRYDGTEDSLEKFASYVDTYIDTLLPPSSSGVTYDFDVVVEGGRVKITENNGNGFTITDFKSDGAGKVVASVLNGQGANGVNAVVLDDTVFEDTAITKTVTDANGDDAGLVDPTEVLLDFNGNDTYEFRISDGTATAIVNPFSYSKNGLTVAGSQGEIVNAINVALKTAGLDGVMSASEVAGTDQVKVTHVLGNRITIEGFDSIDSGTILVEGTSGSTGVATYLDDDTGATGKVIKNLDISTMGSAQDALDVISRALEDINMQRAEFGAVENRLEYTINNLSNIAMNTAAAKSRIEDADYAKESAKLAKTQVLQQAGTAILAQANMTSQQVLKLLNG